jgi:hypothetical protein
MLRYLKFYDFQHDLNISGFGGKLVLKAYLYKM